MVTKRPNPHSLVLTATDKIMLTISYCQCSDGTFVTWRRNEEEEREEERRWGEEEKRRRGEGGEEEEREEKRRRGEEEERRKRRRGGEGGGEEEVEDEGEYTPVFLHRDLVCRPSHTHISVPENVWSLVFRKWL